MKTLTNVQELSSDVNRASRAISMKILVDGDTEDVTDNEYEYAASKGVHLYN